MNIAKLSNDNLFELALELLPLKMTEEEQRVSIQIYRLLAKGEPLPLARLAETSELSEESVKAIVESWPGVFYDAIGRIQAYWGLALTKMGHRFEVEGKKLYAWCAWDTLFMPELIGKTATVESTCPVEKEKIKLKVGPDGTVKELVPDTSVMSMMTVDKDTFDKNIISNFCHYVYFFSSEEAGQKWVADHEGTYIMSVEEGARLSSQKNRIQYKNVLGA